MKSSKVLVMVCLLVLAVAVSSTGFAKEKTLQLRLAWSVALQEDHPYTVAAQNFKKTMEKRTNGAVEVTLYPGGQLGGDADIFQALQFGNIDVAVLSTPVIASTTKVLAGVDMPYIFNNDYDLLYKVCSGAPGKKLLKRLEEEVPSVKALCFLYQPFRHIYSKKEIKSIDDLKGLKFRCMQSPIHIDIFKALGATPTPIPYTEVYTAMQSGTIDAFESDVIGGYTSKFHEVAKYLTISGHFNNGIVMMMSAKTWNKLSASQRKAAQAASLNAAKGSFETTVATNDKYMKLTGKYLKINKIDLAPFVAAEKPIIEKYSQQIPEIKEFVKAVQAMKKNSKK
jgi:tripartite ATP-independent transporter DctP family solute receptor